MCMSANEARTHIEENPRILKKSTVERITIIMLFAARVHHELQKKKKSNDMMQAARRILTNHTDDQEGQPIHDEDMTRAKIMANGTQTKKQQISRTGATLVV